MKNLVKYKKGKRSKIILTENQIGRENSNWMELYEGESGSGKTWSAISDCYARDPNFDVTKQLVFSTIDFMRAINSPFFKDLKIKQLIFDEPQAGELSSREWQSPTNKLFNYILTTFRHQNIVTLFCSPYRDFLDSNSMKMIHCITEMVSIDRKNKKVRTKPMLQQYNSKRKKTYQHSIRVIRDAKVNKLVFDLIPKPPQHLIDAYEKMKTDYTDKLNKEVQNKLESYNEPERLPVFKKALTDRQQEVFDLMNKHHDTNKVAEILKISQTAIHKHLQLCRNKGYIPKKPAKSSK